MRFEAVVNRLLRRDGDFAREPLRAPREANPAPQLTGDHLFHHARAEALVCGWRHGGAVRFGPTQHDPAVCRATTPPERNHRVPTGHRTWPRWWLTHARSPQSPAQRPAPPSGAGP